MNTHELSRTSGLSRRTLHRMLAAGALFGMSSTAQSAAAPDRLDVAASGSLEDQLGIERLLYQYAIAIDSLDVVALRNCFAPNAVIEGLGERLQGNLAEQIIDGHRVLMQTMHLVMNHLHTITDRTANGVTYCVASLIRKDVELIKKDLYIRYTDVLVKQENHWYFLQRHLDVLFATEGRLESFDAEAAKPRRR